MNGTKSAHIAAYAAAVIFVIRLSTFYLPVLRDATPATSPFFAELNAILGITPHLLLFPVVAALVAPQWAKGAGYGWLAIDMATDIMDLNGVSNSIYISMRYGGHISAGVWIAVASWQARGALRIVGLLLALNLAGYSFVAPFVPPLALVPSLVLLPLWLFLAGRNIIQRTEEPQAVVKANLA